MSYPLTRIPHEGPESDEELPLRFRLQARLPRGIQDRLHDRRREVEDGCLAFERSIPQRKGKLKAGAKRLFNINGVTYLPGSSSQDCSDVDRVYELPVQDLLNGLSKNWRVTQFTMRPPLAPVHFENQGLATKTTHVNGDMYGIVRIRGKDGRWVYFLECAHKRVLYKLGRNLPKVRLLISLTEQKPEELNDLKKFSWADGMDIEGWMEKFDCCS